MRKLIVAVVALPLLAGGCIRTVASVATAPVKVAGKAVDWTTTSSSEADRNYAHKMRMQQQHADKERRKQKKACRSDPSACPPPQQASYGGFQQQ
jgi:hypothetical protein